MNRITCIVFGYLAILATCLALDPTCGTGQTLTVGTTVQSVALSPPARVLSVVNQGASTVYAGVNISTNDFYTSVTNGTALPVPANSTYTFELPAWLPIKTAVVCSIASTNIVVVSATQ